jgi:large repetitive protein
MYTLVKLRRFNHQHILCCVWCQAEFNMNKLLITFLLFFAFAYSGLSQGLTNHNWYFGNSAAGIRFNRIDHTANQVNNQAVPFSTGASSVASNAINAEIRFYTDGVNVYDISNTIMPEGNGLNANTNGNQAVASSPIPGEENKYYIFTNTANFQTGGAIFYSVVDMTLFGNALFPTPALGDLEPTKNVAIPALNNTSEAMIVIPHRDNNGTFWLITHVNNSNTYLVTLIDVNREFTTTPFNITMPAHTAANFSFHPTTNQLAVSPQSNGDNVMLLNFDPITGILSFDRELFNSGIVGATNNQAIFDTEFSPSGDFLYVSIHGDAGINARLLRFDLTNDNTTAQNILSAPIFRSYALQMAPDTAIYHLYQQVDGGPFLLGKILQTDSILTEVIYEAALFNSTNFNSKSLPSFSPAQIEIFSVDFDFEGTCSNVPTTFYPIVIPEADSLRWNFGADQGGSAGWSPIHTYEQGGNYDVTLTAYLNGRIAQTIKTVPITAFNLQITMPTDTVACSCELPISAEPNKCEPFFFVEAQIQGGSPLSTIWSNGQTGNILRPDSAGFYYVVVTDATGCSAYAGVTITEYDVQDQRANIWYFGQNAGIDFNEQPPVPLDDSAMNAPEGCATISDSNGNVIFYTDGRNVYDKNHVQIADDLLGDPGAAQATIIVPVPGDETLYYIFNTMEVHGNNIYTLTYSLFDLKENNGTGDVVKKNIKLFSRSTERLTATANWLIAHEFGNNTFRAYPITPQGIGQPVLSSIGSDHFITNEISGRGYMKLGNNNKLAVTLSDPGNFNVIEIFDFNPATGRLSNFQSLNTTVADGQIYGVEFSGFGTKIFASIQGSPSRLVEFAYDSISSTYELLPPIIDAPGTIGALQTGPDGQIYIAIENSNVLGIILPNEGQLISSFVNFDGFALAGGTQSRLGLPNFIQNLGTPIQPPGISFSGVCFGFPTLLSGSGTSSIDDYAWTIRSSSNQLIHSSDEQAFEFDFPAPDDYFLTLRITNRCGLDTTLTQTITIFDSPPLPLAEYYDDPTFNGFFICDGNLSVNAYPSDVIGTTYLWSTGEITRSVIFANQQLFDITVTDINGCTSSQNGIVVDSRPPVELGPDFTVCLNETVADLNAQQAPTTPVEWLLNNADGSTGNTRPVSTATAGEFTFTVAVTDPLSQCVGRDSVTITVNPMPIFTVNPINTTGCGLSDGEINFEITSTGSFTYLITGPETRNGFDVVAPSGIINENLLPPGAYTVIIIDEISGCSDSQAAPIDDFGPFNLDPLTFAGPVCDQVEIEVNAIGLTGNANFNVIDVNGGAIIQTGTSPTPNFNTAPVAPGRYIVEVTDANSGCVSSEEIDIVADPAVTFTTTFDVCVSPATAEVELTSLNIANPIYLWSGASIVGASNNAQVSVNASGIYTIMVSDADNNFCPTTREINLILDNQTSVAIVASDPCEDFITLRADISTAGTYTYLWFRNNVPIQGSGSQIVAGMDDNNASYRVRIRNTASGCEFESTPLNAVITGPVQVNLSSTIACDNDAPFTITANTNAVGALFTWFFNDNLISGQVGQEIIRTNAGNYKVIVEQASCDATDDLEVILLPAYDSELADRAIICNDPDNSDPTTSEIELNPGNGFTQNSWFLNGNFISNNQIIIARDPGIYRAELINEFGCETIDEVEVINDCQPKIVAPNAFRPGGVNTNFSVLSFFITNEFQIAIFNRWGEMVYQSNERNFTWNGGYNNDLNRPLPGGQYAYVVKYISIYRPERGIQEKRGSILLLR